MKCGDEKMKILIVASMGDVELNYLKQKLEKKEEKKYNLCTFYEGKMKGKQVILCDAKVGLINAAAATTLAIEKYHPDIIINQGCAGGIDKNVHKSDLVIGIECINITSVRTKYRDIGQGIAVENWELINFLPGEEDRLVPQKCSEKLLNLVKSIESKYKYGKVHYGIIGSGDIWNKESDMLINLNKKYGIICEEMESIAVYTIANQYNIPVINIRVISDNEILKEEYERGISYKAQEFVECLVQEL